MNNHCLTEELKQADEEEKELRTLLEDKQGMTWSQLLILYTYMQDWVLNKKVPWKKEKVNSYSEFKIFIFTCMKYIQTPYNSLYCKVTQFVTIVCIEFELKMKLLTRMESTSIVYKTKKSETQHLRSSLQMKAGKWLYWYNLSILPNCRGISGE